MRVGIDLEVEAPGVGLQCHRQSEDQVHCVMLIRAIQPAEIEPLTRPLIAVDASVVVKSSPCHSAG